MRSKQKEQPRSIISDVTQRGVPEPTGHAVVNLKPHFLKRYRYAITGGLGVIAIGGFLLSSYFSQAAAVYFYPDACLGNWEDVQKAQGKPDAAAPEEIGPHNAALLDKRAQEIYCGSFEGEVPEGSALRTLSLKLSWVASDERLKAPKVVVPAEVSGDQGGAETTFPTEQEILDDALDVQSPSSAEFDIVIEGQDQPAPEAGGGAEAPVEPEAPAAESEPAAPEAPAEPTSWMFGTRVRAQEVPLDIISDPAPAEPEPVADPEPEPAPEPEPVLEPEPAELPAGEGVSTTASSSLEADPADYEAMLAIEYSLDGKSWLPLKEVTRANFAESIAVPLTQWEEIPKLQVRVSRLSTIDDLPFIYLDGMELIGEYDETEGMPMPDFEKDQLLSIRSNDRYALFSVVRTTDNRQVLWLFERTEIPQWRVIATDEGMQRDSVITLLESHVFWMSADGRAIVGYDAASGTYFSKTVEARAEQGLELPFGEGRYVAVRAAEGIVIRDETSLEVTSGDDDAEFSAAFWELARTGKLHEPFGVASSTESVASTTENVASSTGEAATSTGDGEPAAGPEPAEQVPEEPEPVDPPAGVPPAE